MDGSASHFLDPLSSDQSEVWDVALACRNGHLINDRSRGDPSHNAPWCAICGSETISACPGCREPIAGFYYDKREPFETSAVPSGRSLAQVPQYCHACGRPFPWTERVMSAARSLIRELAGLDPYERDQLRRSIDDIIRETPRTPMAVLRIQAALGRIGGDSATALRSLLISVANESVKRQLA